MRQAKSTGAILFAVGLAFAWFAIGDLKGPFSNHVDRLVDFPLVAASDLLVAASSLAMAALLFTKTPPGNRTVSLAVLSAIFLAYAVRYAAERDRQDVGYDGWAALLGLILLGSFANAFVQARKRPPS